MGRPKSYDRAEVLRKATEVFWDKGYEGTHLSELVERTGLNRFSLYNEFDGKEGLFRACLDHYLSGLEGLNALFEREPLGLDNIRRVHRGTLDFAFRHGCLAMNTVREKHVVPSSAWEAVEAFAASVEEGFRKNLVAAQQQGELAEDRDPAILAKVLAVVDTGLLSHRALNPEDPDLLRIVEEVERLLE